MAVLSRQRIAMQKLDEELFELQLQHMKELELFDKMTSEEKDAYIEKNDGNPIEKFAREMKIFKKKKGL